MFDPALLRTFLAVAETGSFTQAAARLGLSQPTVSQQVRKLEHAAARVLIARDTREVSLTDNGDAMVGFARSILATHAAAENYFRGSATRGRLRFGAADDLANTQLPRIIREFRQLHPQINLELTVSQTLPLQRGLAAGKLDLIFTKELPGMPPSPIDRGASPASLVRSDAMVWMAQERTMVDEGDPVPLILYQAPSLSRQVAIEALEEAGRTWRITCTVKEVNGLLAAVRAGIGISTFPHTLIPDDLMKVSNKFQLPALGGVDFVLRSNPAANADAVEALSAAIRGRTLTRT